MRISFKSIPPCVGKQTPAVFFEHVTWYACRGEILTFFDLDMSLPRVHT